MKSIDTLVPDIQALFDGHNLGGPRLAVFAAAVAANFETRFGRYGNEYKTNLYLSNIGKPLRQLWYTIKSGLPGEVLPADKKLSFLYGDILEEFVLLLAEEAGHTVERRQEKVEVDGVRGKIDAVIDGWLVDAKSCSSRSFDKFKSGKLYQDDPFGYIGQLSGYASALHLPAAFLAIDKVLGHICLMKVPQERIDAYDVRSRIAECRQVLNADEPPEAKCYPDEPHGVSKTAPFGNGNRVLGVGCSYCSFKGACWAGANEGRGLRTFLYSSGPEFFTTIKPGKEPKVFEVKNGRQEEAGPAGTGPEDCGFERKADSADTPDAS